jgi:DNA-binding response OmpR family regulator
VSDQAPPFSTASRSPSFGKVADAVPILWWTAQVEVAASDDRDADEIISRHTRLSRLFAEHAAVELLDVQVLRSMIEPVGCLPDVLVAEYDYPDLNALRLLREVRERFPLLPIVIFTLQHSEALAVWALRNRVWDYFVKPLAKRVVQRIVVALL